MNKQEGFPFVEVDSDSHKNAIVIEKESVDAHDFDSLSWVLRARSKDKTRMNLYGLYSDGQGEFVATDGHRMHIAEIPGLTEKIPEGIWLYIDEKSKRISILEAPESIAAYPAYDTLSDLSEMHQKKGWLVYAGDPSATLWAYFDITGIKCNIDFLMDVIQGTDAMEIFVSPDASAPIFFCCDNGSGNTKKAILMPMKPTA